jgi:membrane fusion protein
VHGRVSDIAVSEGEVVVQGQSLLSVSSDRGSTSIPSLASSQIRSLQNELDIVSRDKSANEKLQQSIVDDANLKLVTVSRRLTLANRELEVVSDRVALSASRVQRQESLDEQGAISLDRIEQIRAEHLSVEHDQLRVQRAIIELDLEKQQLVAGGARAKIERVINNLAADSQNEKLHRLITEKSLQQSQHILSPKSGKIVRLGVRAGDVVGAGHTLLSIAAEMAETEAWVYVSAHEAGTLRVGQEIELRLEAYPHQLFGTVTAAVSSVTRLAVLPRDVRAPIAVAGPVFEIRARISRQLQNRMNAGLLPGIGAPFTADIIRHRYRLYEWLLRSRVVMADPERA